MQSFLKHRPILVCVGLLAVAACRKASAPSKAGQPLPGASSAAAAAPANGAPAQPAPPPPQAGAPAAAKPVPAVLPAVVARVNGESIERWELENAIRGIKARAGSPMPAERRDEIIRGLVDQLIGYHILSQEAHARKLDATDADVDARIAQIKSGLPTPEAFQQALAARGLSLEQLRAQTRMSIQASKIIEAEVSGKISVADADVEAFYNQNLDRFRQGETVHASHILIATPQNADAAAKQQARVKAEVILKALKGGADFAAVARSQSMDPGSARNGGDLGFFQRGQMEPSFEQAAFALKPGTTSGIVETSYGFHIIRALEKRGPRTAPLAEVGPQVKEFLISQQREARINAFVDAAKARSRIEVLI
jgi:peptidyl-prolyl cis-trans isomerase C